MPAGGGLRSCGMVPTDSRYSVVGEPVVPIADLPGVETVPWVVGNHRRPLPNPAPCLFFGKDGMALWGVTHRGMATHNIRGNEGEQRMGNMDHINSGDETAIIPVIDMAATKEDTWEDTARPRLPHTGFGGYQPAAVDAAIGDYERRLGQAKSQANSAWAQHDLVVAQQRELIEENKRLATHNEQLRDQLEQARHDAANSIEALAKQQQGFVNDCRARGERLVQEAQQQCDRLTSQAQQEADKTVAAAHTQADQMVASAQQTAKELTERGQAAVQEGERQAARIVEDANRQAEQQTRQAQGEADRIVKDATAHAQQVQVECDRMVAQAREQAAHAKGVYTEYMEKLRVLADKLNSVV